MPLSSRLSGRVAGASTSSAPLGLQRAGLYVEPGDVRLYRDLVALVERETQPGDTILALPSNAELYFLSQRRNPYRFYNSALGLRTAADLDSAASLLEPHPPRMVFFNPKDKYNTPYSERLIELVRTAYDPLETVPPLEIFRRRNSAGTSAPGICPRDKGD